MVDEIRLNPLGAVRACVGHLLVHGSGRIQHEVVNWALAQLLESLLRKRLDCFHAIQLERQDRDLVLVAVIFEPIVGIRGRLEISGAEDELVRLRLGKQLLDDLEPLHHVSNASFSL
jgi:hypothetical protein